jgi:hypothetical protein
VDGGEAEAVLQQQRHQEQRAHETGGGGDELQAGDAEEPIPVDPQPEQGRGDPLLDDDEGGQQRQPGQPGAEYQGRAPAGRRADRDRVQQQREPGRREKDARQVEPPRRVLGPARQEERADRDRRQADRQVDVEDPPPGEPVDQGAADHRAEGRRQQRGDDQDLVGLDPLGGREHPGDHRHPDRDQHPAAEALQRPERDQLGQRRRHPAQRGRGREQPDRPDQDVAAAEPVAHPAGGGHRHRQRHQVGGHDPAHRADRRAKIPAQRG